MGDGPGLRHLGDDGAGIEAVAFFNCHMGVPFLFCIQGIRVDAPVDVAAAFLLDGI